jgi:hypothetical protein
MAEKIVFSFRYQQIATTSIILFSKSMRLYETLENQAAKDPDILKNGKVQKGLAQIIETIDTSGRGLESLPEPPFGMEDADRCFRELGKDIRTLAGYLNNLVDFRNIPNKQQNIYTFKAHAEKVKQNLRQAILSLDQESSEGIS